MKRCLTFLAFLLVAAVAGCGTPAAIQDVLDHPDRYVNQRVSVSGVVEDTTVLEVKPLDNEFRGQVLLRDKTGSITVKTRRNPPAKGAVTGFTGVLKQAKPGDIMAAAAAASPGLALTTPPPAAYFLEQSPPLPVALVGALAALLVLAAVLVYLLVRQPAAPGVVCASCGRSNRAGTEVCRYCHQPVTGNVPPPPPPPAKRTCPHCQAQNEATSRFCESCGKEMGETVTAGRAGAVTQVFDPVLGDLRMLDGDGVATNRTWDLVARKQTIGSQANVDVCISGDATVSREHARIWCEDGNGGGFCVQDLASTNGTFVNGKRIVKQMLADGDTIQVGRTRLLFRMNAPRSQP